MVRAGAAPTSRFDLSADEHRLLVDRLPGLVLPPEWRLPVAEPRVVDETTLLASLASRGVLLSSTDDADLRPHASPALLAALAVHELPGLVLAVHAWRPDLETRSIVTLAGGAAGVLTLRRPTGQSFVDGRVEVALAPPQAVVGEVLDLLPEGGRTKADLESTELGLAASRAVVEALRRGDGPVTAAVVDEVHADGTAVDLLRQLTGSMTTGYQVTALDGRGRGGWSATWLLGDEDWLKIGLVVPQEARGTAEGITDHGRVRLTRVGTSFVRADVLGVVASYVRQGTQGEGRDHG